MEDKKFTLVIGASHGGGHKLKDEIHVISNAESTDELSSAYAVGAKQVGVDIQDLCEDNYRISVADFEKIKSRVRSDELHIAPDEIFYERMGDETAQDFFEEDAEVILNPQDYFRLWRATALIGNPKLHIRVIKDESSTLKIGGYGTYTDLD